jgi:hypothetical protein
MVLQVCSAATACIAVQQCANESAAGVSSHFRRYFRIGSSRMSANAFVRDLLRPGSPILNNIEEQ